MRFCVLKMISVAFCIFVSSVYATEATRLSIANNTNLLKSISRILVEKNSRTVAQRKISSHLLKTKEDLKVGVKQFQNKTNSVPSFVVNSLGVTYCKVVIRAEVTDSLVKKLQSHGAVDIKTHPRWKTISCRIPADEMEKIAEDSSVYSIREQTRPILNKANTSEGVSAHQIDKAVSKFGVTGKGIKIGVISDSVRFLNDVQASGDLPDVTVLPGHDGASYDKNGNRIDTGEGTAMLEIVHDVAPEAELYFATASPTDAQFADNIIALQKEGCHIIVDDVGYFNEPAFQDGIIAQAVNEVRSKGCLYFSAAGNSGNKKLSKSGTYEGDFVPFGTQIINGEEYEYHSFDGKEATKFYCGRSAVTLQWADQWGGSGNDYALLLFTADGNVIGFSDDVQNGSEGSCPYEIVRCCGDESCAHNSFGYLYVLKKKNAARRYFRIDTLRGSLEVSTSGSTYGHSAAESAVCVGAASTLNGVFSSASTMEDYSSDGPRRIFYNPDGSAITPGNFLSTGGKILEKVDITAGDYVSCATPGFADFPGFNPFPGTSAAAPHAAAIAALMLQARPDLTQEEIVEIMGNTAWRLNGHDSPWDELSGRGIVNALAAVEEAMYYGLPSAATPSLTPSTTFFGNKTVYVICEDSSVTVRYTTDGTVPAESSPEFPASGLVVNETKTISIRAFKDGCRPSSTASATYTKGTIPSCPSVTISGTTMTWTAPTGAKYYKVYRSTNPYADPEAVTGWQTSRSYTITKPSSEGTAYFYFVKASPAQDDAMAGPFNPVRVVTGDGRYTLLQYSTSRNYSVKNADTEFHLYGSGSISDTPYSQQSIAAASSSVKFTKSTGSGITVRANGYDISNNPSVSGGIIARWTMDVSASANTSTSPKSYSFYSNATAPSGFSSTAGGTWAQHYMNWIGRPHYIYQAGKAAFSVGATSQSVDAEEGIYSLKITATPTTTSWTASTSDDWISLYRTSSTGSGVLGFVVGKNEGSARTGTITLAGASKTVTFTISQSGGEVAPATPVISSVTTTDSSGVTISWGAVSGVTRYDLYRSTTTTRPSSAYKTNVTSPYSDTDATPGTTYYYWVSAVNSAGVSYSGYKSGKRAESLTISSSSVSASASGRSGTVSVTANCGWTVSKNVSWITVSPTSGSGSGTISYTIVANTTSQSRPGTITVTSSGGITRTIAVSQEGLPMYEVAFNPNGGTLSGGATRNIVSGAEIGTLPTPTRDGYTFLGWFTAAEGGEQVTESTVVTGNMTLYAHWEEYAGVDDDGYTPVSMFEYEICADGVRITKYKGSAAVVNIPPTIDGFPVVKIGYDSEELDKMWDPFPPMDGSYVGAFKDCISVVEVKMPDTVVCIGGYTFYQCNALVSVSMSANLMDIGECAFLGCSSLGRVVIPDGVKRIDASTFNGCSSLESVSLSDGITSIDYCAFDGCSSLVNITIPDSVTYLGEYAFRDCLGLSDMNGFTIVRDVLYGYFGDDENVIIPNGVVKIEGCAFEGCGFIVSVTIPDGVTSIGWGAFEGCYSLKNIKIPDSVVVIEPYALGGYGSKYSFHDDTTISGVYLADGWVVGAAWPSGSLDLTGARGIGGGVFDYYVYDECYPITSVFIPSTVKSIGEKAFYGCSMLEDVTISEGVLNIEDDAFVECSSLTSIVIPNTVTNIGYSAFNNCASLLYAKVPHALKDQVEERWVFNYCRSDLQIEYYCVVKFDTNGGVLSDTFQDVAFGAVIGTLPTPTRDGYTFLGWFTAAEGGELITESTVVTGDVTYYAQWEVASKIKWTIDENGILTSVGLNGETFAVIPDGVTSIGERAFLNCSSLTSVEIPNSVTNIGDYAFANCYNLTSVMIPSSIMGVGDHAFSGCYSLISIIIPEGVSYIGDWAFANCSSLDRVVIPSSVTDIGAYAFYFCTSLTTIVIPDGVMRIGGWAFHYCQLITHVTIPGSVRSIGMGAFDHCESLTSVTMLNGVTTIGDQVFADCSSLMSVTIPRSVTSIGMGVFSRSFSGLHIVVDEENASYKLLDGFLFSKDGSVLHSYVGGLSSITIPEGVTNIGDGAFFSCATLASVTIPNSVTNVGAHAFFECGSLTSVIIPTSVTSIGEYAFYNCDSLKEITIPTSVTSIGEYAFFSCSSLTSVVIPGSVKRISDSAFALCARVKNVKIEEGVIEIGDGAFYQVGYNSDRYDGVELFERLILPKSVNKIGDQAFSSAGIKYVEGLDETDEIHENAFINTPYAAGGWYAPVLRIEDDVVTGIDWEYRSDDGCITNYVLHIPDGITAIGDDAFSSLDCFSYIRLPESLRDIGNGAFESCYNMEEINIPEGVSNINDWTFGQCSRLEEVKLPSTVTNIGQSAFSYCNSLRDINIPEQVVSIGDDAFYDCDSLSDIVFPNTLEYIGDYAFDDCNSLSEVVIPSSIKYIGVDAFGYYYSEHHYLKSITIPQALCESNEDNSWFCLRNIGCYGITNLVIESGVTNIGQSVFSGLWSLQSVTIPDSVTFIGGDAFFGCYSLANVTIPENVTSIGWGAFGECDALENITIPLGVTSIGPYAFDSCDSLLYAKVPLVLKEQVEEGEVFYGCSDELVIEYYEAESLALPVITPTDGTEFYEDSCMVTISCETEGATIYYTTDGTTPRPRPANLYTEPFEIADTTTVKAIAVKGDKRTDLVSATIVKKEIVLSAPVITPADGTEFYEDSCMVTISCATEGASIYYVVCDTNNVTNPRPIARNLYTGPFTVSGTKMVRAFSMFGSKTSDIVSATLIKRELTLSVAVDAPELTFTTGGDAQWTPEFNGSANVGGSLAQSGALSWSMENDDPSETWMETTVAGAGTFSFWWKVDCEDDPWGATWDHLKVSTNGVEIARIDGKTEWEQLSFTFNDVGTYTIRWTFCKDDWDDEKLPDIACVDGVVWTPVLTDITVDVGGGKTVAVPASWIDKYGDILAAADGDKTAALMLTAANGRKVWECFMLGVDPTRADDDFRITRFWMENSKPKFEFSHSVDGAGNSFLSRLKIKGKAKLSDGWADVPPDGDSSYQFFTVEVMLP